MKVSVKDVEKYYNKSAHDMNHVLRVYKNSLRIAEKEDCDIEVVKAAALLHDIARHLDEYSDKLCHAEEGAKMAEKILQNYDYTPVQVRNIVHSIRVHRYSKGLKPETIEAKILQDADRLDALGAIIVARVFYSRGTDKGVMYDPKIKPEKKYKGAASSKTAINHFYEKILKITPDTFHTKIGCELANNRYDFTKKFVEQFIKEWNCEI
ncbi:Ribonuclease Y [Candidatus Tiddalikarchaeum anstoanum]|nr:Ribonuclease Y [Candidatus Tiddalikarchaeum anstoanum]